MNAFASLGRILVSVLLLTLPMRGADRTTRFVAQPESKVKIAGQGSMHDWSVEGKIITGLIEVGPDFPTAPRQELKPGKVEARVEASIPVTSLKNVDATGKPFGGKMDTMMHLLLSERTAPNIAYHSEDLVLKSSPKTEAAAYEFASQGSLVVAGVTNLISMPVFVTPLGGKKLKITGKIAVKMTDFGIQPPALQSQTDPKSKTSQEIKLAYDEVTLSFEWLLEAASSAPAK